MRFSQDKLPEASESFFRHLLETAPDAMIIVDRRGRIVVVNSQVERMFGYLRDELYGEFIEILLPEDYREVHVKHREGYDADPRIRPMGSNFDLSGVRKDGSEFPVEISLSPVRTDAGSFVSSVIRDVTERKAMERELIEARKAAELANKANTAFLAAASHDLRQPVQALTLLNGVLRRTLHDPDALEMIQSQQQSLDAMTNLLNSLLDISRLDAGAIEPEIEVFPLQLLIDRLSAEFARQASQKGLIFSAAPSPILIKSDPNLLGEIIQNLVSNAIRYTDKGQVELHCEESDGNVCVRICDSGIGIGADDLQDIFAEFYQVKRPGQKNEGFGLGLAIVQRLCELLGHTIEVDSAPGNGSEFSICVPAIAIGDQQSPAVRSTASARKGQRKSGTIILIEDDTAVANALVALMESEGHRVASTVSAKEAAAIANHLATKPDLIISDFHLLDGSTGIEAVVELRKSFAMTVPAFIITGDTSVIADAVRDLPKSLLIRKPVNPDQLLRDVGFAIDTRDVPDAGDAG